MPKPLLPVFSIGFTKKTAAQFFETLRSAGVRRVIDVRLNNVSQLAGFAKRDDLKYFLPEILDVEYVEAPSLAPTQSLLDSYKKGNGAWENYARDFRQLMKNRRIEKTLDPALLEGGCLLCSEDQPHHCHRSLILEYLQTHWGNLSIRHLGN